VRLLKRSLPVEDGNHLAAGMPEPARTAHQAPRDEQQRGRRPDHRGGDHHRGGDRRDGRGGRHNGRRAA
jgi:hypothetical protein